MAVRSTLCSSGCCKRTLVNIPLFVNYEATVDIAEEHVVNCYFNNQLFKKTLARFYGHTFSVAVTVEKAGY